MIQLIIAADEPALFFTSVEAAEKYLEWIDVRDGVYTAVYGRGGEVYEIWEDGRFVKITPLAAVSRPDELHRLLTVFLNALGKPVAAEESLGPSCPVRTVL